MNRCNCDPCEPNMSLECNQCDPCGGKSGCCPAKFGCDFDIKPDAFDPRYWFFTLNGCTKKVRIPDNDCCGSGSYLDLDCSSKTMTFFHGKEKDIFTGKDLGCLINFEDLANVNIENPEPCSIPVFNPGCGGCPCDPEEETWQAYKIPDAGDCELEPDEDGYYHVLVKNDCGCIEECKIPVVPNGMISLNYMRDSVPDDPDFPWYYGCYNDTINLHLAENAPQYFNKFALKVTVNYSIQACKSTVTPNYNFHSLVVPTIEGENTINVEKESSVLQGFAIYSASDPAIPWGTAEMRGSFSFIVPKGKEAALHHEYRIRTNASFPNWAFNALDGQKVPDDVASQVDSMLWAGSRLHALQVIVEPTMGTADYDPVVDAERTQLDPPVDEYPIN